MTAPGYREGFISLLNDCVAKRERKEREVQGEKQRNEMGDRKS